MRESKPPLVSIIIPAYNAEQYLSQSLESALNQSYQDLEVIVVDDGSTDKSVAIAQEYGSRVKLFQQRNLGAATARNCGVKLSKGQWIAFLDSDDIWAASKIERQLDHCGDLSWSHSDWFFIGHNQDGTIKGSDRAPKFGGDVLSKLIVDNFIGTSTVMVRREVFLEVGGFDDSLRALQDWDLWLRIANHYEIAYLPEPLVQYRVRPSSTSRSPRKTKPYHMELIQRIFAREGVGASMQHLKRRTLAQSYGVLSIIAEDSGDPWFAFSCALRSAWYSPKDLYRWKCIARTALRLPMIFRKE